MKTNPNPVSETDLQARMQRIQDNRQMMHVYFDALFGKDLKPMLDLLDEHIEWLIVPTGDTFRGKEELAKGAHNHWASSPDRIKTLVNVFASEDFACLEYRTGGTLTNQADFPSISFQPTRKQYEFQCCFVFHITNGKIDRVHEYFDMETVKRQLGTVGSHPYTLSLTGCYGRHRSSAGREVRASSDARGKRGSRSLLPFPPCLPVGPSPSRLICARTGGLHNLLLFFFFNQEPASVIEMARFRVKMETRTENQA